MDGNFKAEVNLGLEATGKLNYAIRKPIIAQALPPGFSIPKIVAIGPVISLDARLDINIDASANLLVGGTVEIPNFHATMDMANMDRRSQSGWEPKFTSKFEVDGQLTASATMGLPLTVGVGIKIPVVNFDKMVALVDEPSLTATLTAAYSKNITKGVKPARRMLTLGEADDEHELQRRADKTCPEGENGISVSITAANNVGLDLLGFKTVTLHHYTPKSPLYSNCYK